MFAGEKSAGMNPAGRMAQCVLFAGIPAGADLFLIIAQKRCMGKDHIETGRMPLPDRRRKGKYLGFKFSQNPGKKFASLCLSPAVSSRCKNSPHAKQAKPFRGNVLGLPLKRFLLGHRDDW